MTKILKGWKKVFKDFFHWESIIKRPYDPFDSAIFFNNLNEPMNELHAYELFLYNISRYDTL